MGFSNVACIGNMIRAQYNLLGMLLSELGRQWGDAKPKWVILLAWKELEGFGVLCGAL